MKKAILLATVIFLSLSEVKAFVDEFGRESTQFILDYETGERTYLELNSGDDAMNLYDKCSAELTFINDETGATVEWTIHNGVFYNVVKDWTSSGYAYRTFGAENYFFWEDRCCFTRTYCDGLKTIDSQWNSFQLAGAYDVFKCHDGNSRSDVETTLLSVEIKDIESMDLIGEYFEPCDAPASRTETEFYPKSLVHKDSDIHNDSETIVYVACHHGQYNPCTSSLRAVTHIKYHVSNATYIPPFWASGANEHQQSEIESRAEYYTFQGAKISNPVPGQMYIVRQSGKIRKILCH